MHLHHMPTTHCMAMKGSEGLQSEAAPCSATTYLHIGKPASAARRVLDGHVSTTTYSANISTSGPSAYEAQKTVAQMS